MAIPDAFIREGTINNQVFSVKIPKENTQGNKAFTDNACKQSSHRQGRHEQAVHSCLRKKLVGMSHKTTLFGRLFTGFILLFFVIISLNTYANDNNTDQGPMRPLPPDEESESLIFDPLEPLNRRIYVFNALFDRYVFLPSVRGYSAITPDLLEKGVTHFFRNLREVITFANTVLQIKLKGSAVTATRFAINSTVGILGFFDPATQIGLNRRDEDFGQTLGYWGVGQGFYLVLPLIGPSSLRDTTGIAVDFIIEIETDILNLHHANKDGERIALRILEAIDKRYRTPFRYYESGTPFEYELVRFGYFEMRKIKVLQ